MDREYRALFGMICLGLVIFGLYRGLMWIVHVYEERENYKHSLEQQNQAILEQEIEINKYVTHLQEQKDSISAKYARLAHAKAHPFKAPPNCKEALEELEKIQRGLDVFKKE